MRSTILVFAALASGAATAQAQAPAQADPGERICRTQREVGSRLGGRRICKSRAEWDEEARITRANLDQAQTRQVSPVADQFQSRSAGNFPR